MRFCLTCNLFVCWLLVRLDGGSSVRKGFQRKGGRKDEDDVYIEVLPSAYMDLWNGNYFPGVEFEGATKLFGANTLQDHDVLFSWEDMRVGVAAVTNCQWDGITSD